MPKATLAGHPLHPMLIVAPAALLPFGFVLDAMYRATKKPAYSNAAYYSLMGGLIGGLAAGAAGAADYLEVQPETEVKQIANLHAGLNGGALALTALNLMQRRDKPNHEGGSLLLSALTAAGVMVSGWFGAHMVYEHGMRVKGVSPIAEAPELAPPGDEAVHHAMHKIQKEVPAAGPTLH